MVNQALKDKILALLGNGPLSVTQLSQKLICANQRVMEAVDELDEHGLIVSSVENGSVLYALVNAADAERPVRVDAQDIVVTRKTKADDKQLGSNSTISSTKQKILVLLRESPDGTLTRGHLMTGLKTTPTHEIDNALLKLKSDNTVHSVSRGVIRLGPMPIEEATDAIEKIVAQAIPEQTITDEVNSEIEPVEATQATQVKATDVETKDAWAPNAAPLMDVFNTAKAPELREMKLGVFDDGSLMLRLTSGADLTLTPDEALRAHKLLNLFYRGAQV